MSSILSTISGQFSKALILGTFAPVAAFTILFLILVTPLLPANLPLLQPLEGLDTQGRVIAISLLAIVLSLLLYNLNIPLIRWYEGYPWKDTQLGRWRTAFYRRQLRTLNARVTGMRTLLRAMDAVEQLGCAPVLRAAVATWEQIPGSRAVLQASPPPGLEPPAPAPGATPRADRIPGSLRRQWCAIHDAIQNQRSLIGLQINNHFPPESLLLPTRLGNMIASFEYYPDREYGMDAVTLWPRLVAAIKSDFASSIDDAKISFDFMLNGSALSLALALALALAGVIYPAPVAQVRPFVTWLAEVLAFLLLAYVLYLLAIPRASAWGDMVKSAFDLYKSDLLEQLDYKRDLGQREDERELWDGISRQMLFGDLNPAGPPDYVPAPERRLPHASGQPEEAQFEITRGFQAHPPDSLLTIVLSIRNPDAAQAVEEVVVTDKLPDDLDYEWNSACVNGSPVRVTGSNPYDFHIGDLGANQEKVLTYRAIQRRRIAQGGENGNT